MQIKKFLIQVNYLKKTDLNAKITEIEGKIASITGLATNSPLTAVEKKKQILLSNLTKIREIEKKVSDHNHDIHYYSRI